MLLGVIMNRRLVDHSVVNTDLYSAFLLGDDVLYWNFIEPQVVMTGI